MFCNQCGRQIPDDSRFCNYCGVRQTAVQSAPVQNDPYFDIRHGVLVKYTGRDKNVVVPAGVVEIEKDAFTGYIMESLTIPEGCKKVSVDTFVKTIRFPSTIEYFSLYVDDHWFSGRSADHVYFAPGTKKIKGYSACYSKDEHKQTMKLHIPSSVNDISELHCRHFTVLGDDKITYFDPLIYDDINAFSQQMRIQIYQREGRCAYCGGEFKRTVFDDRKCKSCGKKKNY